MLPVIKEKSCLPDPRPLPGTRAERAWETGSEPQWFCQYLNLGKAGLPEKTDDYFDPNVLIKSSIIS